VLFTYRVLQDLEYQQPGAAFWRQVGIAAGGLNQVVFTLKAPSAGFPLALRMGIIAKHLFDGMAPAQIVASDFSGIRAIGTGPFKVAGINQLAITLDRNPYADPQPYLDHLILRTYPVSDPQTAIRAVLAGAADLVGGLEPPEVLALPARTDLNIQEVRTFPNAFVTFKSAADAKLRSKAGQSFRFDLVVAGPFPTNEVAAGVARQLLEIGIEADVKPVSASDLVQKYLLGRNYLAALVAIDVGSDPDQYTLWHS